MSFFGCFFVFSNWVLGSVKKVHIILVFSECSFIDSLHIIRFNKYNVLQSAVGFCKHLMIFLYVMFALMPLYFANP